MKRIKAFLIKWFSIPAFMNFTMNHGYKRDHTYRITGFYYRYTFADGTTSDPIPCKRRYANCIGGSGVSGCYPFFREVKRVYLKIKLKNIKARLHFWNEYRSDFRQNRIDGGDKKVQHIRSMPKGLSRKEYGEYAIKRAVKSIFVEERGDNYHDYP